MTPEFEHAFDHFSEKMVEYTSKIADEAVETHAATYELVDAVKDVASQLKRIADILAEKER